MSGFVRYSLDGALRVENESLSLTAFRCSWKGAARAFLVDDNHQEIARRSIDALYRGLRNFFGDLGHHGLEFGQLLAAAGDPEKLRALVRQSKNHAYAQFFAQASKLSTDHETILKHWFRHIQDHVFSQIELKVVPKRYSTLPAFREARDRVRATIQPDIDRLARKLAENPKWVPRRLPAKLAGKRSMEAQVSVSLR